MNYCKNLNLNYISVTAYFPCINKQKLEIKNMYLYKYKYYKEINMYVSSIYY